MDPTLVGFCLAMTLAGAGLGLFSGLAPGIHVNTLAAMLLASQSALSTAFSGHLGAEGAAAAVCCCIMSASVVHSFVDFVPSVFIGAPDGEDAVSVLPGHRLLLKGRGMEAVRAAAIGSLVGAATAVLIAVPLQILLSGPAGEALDSLTPLVLILVSGILLVSEHRRGSGVWGPVAFCVSGLLGLMCMTVPASFDGILGEDGVMMPLLTGLFGIPVLLEGTGQARIPRQSDRVRDPVGAVPGLKGVAMGAVAGWFSGITSTVGASVSSALFPESSPARFISCVASVGTVTSILDLVTLSVSGDGRSGTALAIGEMILADDSLREDDVGACVQDQAGQDEQGRYRGARRTDLRAERAARLARAPVLHRGGPHPGVFRNGEGDPLRMPHRPRADVPSGHRVRKGC